MDWSRTLLPRRPDKDPGSLLTDTQRVLADGIRALLRRLRVTHGERVEATRAEAWYWFEIKTPPESGLHVRIAVVGDVFVFQANEAEVRYDLEPWRDDPAGWVAMCLGVVQGLLQSELRIRLRRTMLGGTTGAVWVGGEAWGGELFACRGRGREYTYPAPWFLADDS